LEDWRKKVRQTESTGTGKWARRGVPHKGWTCTGVTDLGEPLHICEMCETMTIRYVHHMHHDDYPEDLDCGCVCAGHMEDDYVNAQARERWMHNVNSRRKNWLTRAWRTSRKGNAFLNTDGCNIVVFELGSGYGYRIEHIDTERSFKSKRFPSEKTAKLAAFDKMIQIKLAEHTTGVRTLDGEADEV
jgi:hypothetical protein